ncbi:MAG: D-2-hydroxyacid dehydrogenase [Thermomicrobia bacterium]|nr:D-2-hydroxyacid dehydrogenase [Thermomicrobia bacterium]MCA1724592.1 D-2-hydroxyacid dehydrogenase [Thermomicrobia bacterium]
MTTNQPLTVAIASPLEAEHVATLRAEAPGNVTIRYEPDLLPPMRYNADHDGPPEWTRTPAQQAAWATMLREADALWDIDRRAGVHPCQYAPKVRWIGTTSAGVGMGMRRLGVTKADNLIITTASGTHAGPMAEFALYGILHFVKEGPYLLREKAAHHWARYDSGELTDAVLVVIGPGKIGQAVARRAHGFDMHTIAVGTGREYPHFDEATDRAGLPDVLRRADAVVLCAPHTDETENILSAAMIALLKPSAIVVNISRGQLVDEAALTDALANHRLRGAALDVFRTEPLPPASPLWDLENVIINPHSASTAARENERLTALFAHNLRCFAEGRITAMRNILDLNKLY